MTLAIGLQAHCIYTEIAYSSHTTFPLTPTGKSLVNFNTLGNFYLPLKTKYPTFVTE